MVEDVCRAGGVESIKTDSINQLDDTGRTAAEVAAQYGHTDIVELLQGLGVEAEVDFANEDSSDDSDGGDD